VDKVKALVMAIAIVVASCGGAQVRQEPAQVRFVLEPDTARVYVEDRFVGAGRVLARRPASFTPGIRYITITADGYFPHDLEMDLPSGTTTVRVSLRPIPR
jgi:hypothetical protein